MTTVLITGGSGFVGRELVRALLRTTGRTQKDRQVHATTFTGVADLKSMAGVDTDSETVNAVHWHELDIGNAGAVDDLIARVRPSLVFHLAAQAHVPTSFADPDGTWTTNLHGTLNLLRATADHAPDATFINVASSDPYGASFRAGAAVTEATPFLPLNPYAASKAAADLAAYQFAANTDLTVIRARPFNHSGPGQGEGYVLPGFAAQIARIEAGLQEPVLRVGDLSTERDFLHVKDVVAAYVGLAEQAHAMESGAAFNIASGRSWRMADMLQQLIALSTVDIRVETDPARLRPADIQRVCGDSQALREAIAWQPCHSMDALLGELLTFWREAVADSL